MKLWIRVGTLVIGAWVLFFVVITFVWPILPTLTQSNIAKYSTLLVFVIGLLANIVQIGQTFSNNTQRTALLDQVEHMSDLEDNYSESQRRFLNVIATQLDEKTIDKKFVLVHYGNKRCLKNGRIRIILTLSEDELFQLARLGYFKINVADPSIIFTRMILERKVHIKKTNK